MTYWCSQETAVIHIIEKHHAKHVKSEPQIGLVLELCVTQLYIIMNE